MEKLTDYKNLCYSSYLGQSKQLRKIAIERLGADKVAMMSNTEVEEYFRKEGYVPMVVCIDDGCCNTETVYLMKEDVLDSKDTIKLFR